MNSHFFSLPLCAEYTPENPKIMTKCSHHFHLGCIYEWMERSESCPVCGKVTIILTFYVFLVNISFVVIIIFRLARLLVLCPNILKF